MLGPAFPPCRPSSRSVLVWFHHWYWYEHHSEWVSEDRCREIRNGETHFFSDSFYIITTFPNDTSHFLNDSGLESEGVPLYNRDWLCLASVIEWWESDRVQLVICWDFVAVVAEWSGYHWVDWRCSTGPLVDDDGDVLHYPSSWCCLPLFRIDWVRDG